MQTWQYNGCFTERNEGYFSWRSDVIVIVASDINATPIRAFCAFKMHHRADI